MGTLKLLLSLIGLLALIPCSANNLQISNVTFDGGEVTFDISWDNSWRGPGSNPGHHDAVWIFVKVAPNGGPQWNHVSIDVTNEGTLDVVTPPDLIGAFVRRGTQGAGTVSSTLSFDLLGTLGLYADIKVFGIEMAYIPFGPYYLGDGTSLDRFHKGNDDTQPYLVANSGLMAYGTSSIQIYTNSTILTSDVPAEFPNGYNSFYCMKYELSQHQYAEFLNCLTLTQQNNRTATDVTVSNFTNTFVMSNSSSVMNRNGVRCLPPTNGDPLYFFCDLDADGIPNEANDGQNLAMNYMSYNDLKAYLDWAGLRPMSMFEYEKACRGPANIVADECAWGTAGFTPPGTIVDPGEATETFSNTGATGVFGHGGSGKLGRCGFAGTSTSTRLTSGGGYYGVMELSGNVSEFCMASVSALENAYGNGELDSDGFDDIFPSGFCSKGYGSSISVASVSDNVPSLGTVGTARTADTGGRGVR